VPERPFGLDAVQSNSCVPPCEIVSSMFVSVSVGFTPVQLAFGQPAADPETVDGADSTAGLVVNVRLPFLISLPGIVLALALTAEALAGIAVDAVTPHSVRAGDTLRIRVNAGLRLWEKICIWCRLRARPAAEALPRERRCL
jgi:hypothetical protein